MKKESVRKILVIAGGMALLILGIFIIPRIVNKCANKAYKRSISKKEINFDEMGPEIEIKSDKKGE